MSLLTVGKRAPDVARTMASVLLCLTLWGCDAGLDPFALAGAGLPPVAMRISPFVATVPASAAPAVAVAAATSASATQPGLSLVAGSPGGAGNLNGVGSLARFAYPGSMAVDTAGNRYIADQNNNQIRKVRPDGSVSTLAGASASTPGAADGRGAAARFYSPVSIAIDRAGMLYVADSVNHTIRKVSPQGVVTTLAGRAGDPGSADGRGSAARFFDPKGVAVDVAGNVLVSDSANQTIRKISPDGNVTTLAGSANNVGALDGIRSAARFSYPEALVTDAARNVYVVDRGNGLLRKITPAGIVTTLASGVNGVNFKDITGTVKGYVDLAGLAIDANGILYGADQSAGKIHRITRQGVVTTLPFDARPPGQPREIMPLGIAVDPSGTLSVTGQYSVYVVTNGTTFKRLAGLPPELALVNGAGAQARFNLPWAVTSDATGNWYVADAGNSMIRKITPAGVVSQLAGSGKWGNVDGTGTEASFKAPKGIVADPLGNVFVADTTNSTIRKITPAGVVTTIAGAPSSTGSTDGPGNLARFSSPEGIAIDAQRNLYVGDTGNHTIRKISTSGVVSTLAGSPGRYGSEDGTGAAARLASPRSMSVDQAGNVYVISYRAVRRITPAGVVTTWAGQALAFGNVDAVGEDARFGYLLALTADAAGNVYVSDTAATTIRKIDPWRRVTTVAGLPGSIGIRTGVLPASFAFPSALAVTGPATLAVIDENAVLRLVLPK
ncbi:NHL repeat-containing protein [Actimicrobium sp. CCC2.4]|uniref:NHL repeat-containing protein n=1 Tax=Actimicrobium sp. CCC2.4 TaxID=3048606 RepID=UPI002AC8EBF8|nr:NHL repeat-containing protein [Actimicrobium sp. CCC2.4]MEB0136431.1 NHL repeat-containing protein [Actimicrobium sp. CCC2.4]WPX31250.1 NHL repeat-containing protein [Actimicrobium sp. CCC2.4]